MTSLNHFGVTVRSGLKYGLRIDRATYATISKVSSIHIPREADVARWERDSEIFEDPEHKIYTDDWCENHQKIALENFDLNMALFADLSAREFDLSLELMVSNNRKLEEVTDLNLWSEGSCVYIMVLDDFKQVYVGIARGKGGLKQRIRQHWSTNKQFDRLIYGSPEESKISIDSFRALDTTRIFAMRSKAPESLENAILERLPSKFCLNRIAGGLASDSDEIRKLKVIRFLNTIWEN